MVHSHPAQLPQWLLSEGASVIGTGFMGAAYATRLSKLGVPVTIFNRTASRAAELARSHAGIHVATTLADCARASKTVIVACSPTPQAIGSVCEQLMGVARDRHVTFIVDAGLAEARRMEGLFDDAGAASVTNVALFGNAYAVMDGAGALVNASGRAPSADVVGERVLPLLSLFGAATYHAGGAASAAHFAMAGHAAYMPVAYGLMHYVALMSRSGIGSEVALQYFQATVKAVADVYAPMLAPTFEKGDYATFFFSHETAKDIHDRLVETCSGLGVDDRLARLMARYHEQALQQPEVATKSFQSVYDVIRQPAKPA